MIKLNYKQFTAELDPLGAELIALYKDGKNLIWCRDPEVWGSSAPLLFPICGRLREGKYSHNGSTYELAPHGFAKSSRFRVTEQTSHRAVFELCDSPETREVYPFAFKLQAVYELNEQGLTFTFIVDNPADTPLYFSVGGHWSFALAETLEAYNLRFDAPVTLAREVLDGAYLSGKQEPVIDGQSVLPLGYHICDNDTYVFKNAPPACTLLHGETPVARLEYPDTPHLLLWTQPGQKYLCIEPWNGMPDGENSGPLLQKDAICALDGGKQKRFTHKIIFY